MTGSTASIRLPALAANAAAQDTGPFSELSQTGRGW